MNMLYLNHIEYATQEDIKSGLVFWARLFKATTWEELRLLSQKNPVAKEVSAMLYQLNAEEKERVLLEAHEKFVDMQRALYRSGYKKAKQENESIIASKDAEIAALKAQLAIQQSKK